jgi:DNA recombination protein RmuC
VLEALRVREEERRVREEQGWGVLQKVAAVLSGSQSTGRAGENILRDAFAHLPPSMLDVNFRVNGRVVEFGLILPDGRRLPVDSKWSAERELLLLAEASDPAERERVMRTIEKAVVERAKEVAAYLDPALTAPVGVAAVPDAAYAVLRRAHADAYRHGVLVMSYSMALPVALFLHSLVARFGSVRDVEACLADLANVLHSVEGTLENSVARATKMLANGTEEMRGQLGKAKTTLARAREQEEENEVPTASLHVVGMER